MKISVIDIGTNSIHAIFAEIRSTGVFQVIGKEKDMVRLGDGMLMSGRLSEGAMSRAMETLKRFTHLARHRCMHRVLATATSAVRESENGGAFLDTVRRETGLKVRVITGIEEGRLIYLAVKNTVDFSGKKALIMDVGGGSTEFILATQSEALHVASLRLGANRLSQFFPLADPPKKSELRRLEEFTLSALAPLMERIGKERPEYLIGTSGTMGSLARLIMNGEEKAPGARQVVLPAGELIKIYARLSAMTSAERARLKGVDRDRADMIVHGASVPAMIVKLAGIPSFIPCDKALREGMLYDFSEKNRKALNVEEEVPDVRRRNILALFAYCDRLKGHCEHTAKLALKLFDEMKSVHGLDHADRELLEYAALLHDVGYHISFHKHHKHSYYLIMNFELNGFSPDEVRVMAWTARMHRRDGGRKDGDFAEMAEALRTKIVKLAALLRIAEALDHSHFALVEDLKVRDEGGTVRIKLTAKADVQWEIHEALARRELFEKIFERKLEFKTKTNGGSA